MVKEIPLQNGMVALVDDEDWERCMELIWSVSYLNKGSGLQVTTRGHCGETISLRRFITNSVKNDPPIISRNGDGLDFRRGNLVGVPKGAMALRGKGHKGSSSKYKGVYWDKRRSKWVAGISNGGKLKYLGAFNNEGEAAEMYNAAAFELWGENCHLNVIGIDNTTEAHVLERVGFCRKKMVAASAFKGITFHRQSKKWRSQISFAGKQIYVGSYPTELEAAKAYDKKAIELHGDKAILNFPNE